MVAAKPNYSRDDFSHSPLLVFYEVTRACNLKCQHCRADAQPERHRDELDTEQAKMLIDQLTTFPKPPLLVFTGGDPFKRKDLPQLVGFASLAGLHTALTPSATALVTREALERLQRSGLDRLAVSLDGADAATHDGFRGVPGSFQRTMEIIADAWELGLPMQINTTVTRDNWRQLTKMAEMLGSMRIALWSVFFLIPTGRGLAEQCLSGAEIEEVFGTLHGLSQQHAYAIKTTEAPHFRRFLMQATGQKPEAGVVPLCGNLPLVGTNDGKGVMFISHLGEIFPSGFLPLKAGMFPLDSVVRVYQQSEMFRSLRDPHQLKGKCGACEFHDICGGSRARAYGKTGDPMAAEPDCAYVPPGWDKERSLCST